MGAKELKTTDEMTMMIDRLKESKARAEVDDRLQGMRSGWEWAARRATVRQLQVIDAMAGEYSDPENLEFDGAAEMLAGTLASNLKDWYGEMHTADDMLRIMFPLEGRRKSPIFLAAFIKSAAGAWKEVAEQVG